MKALNKRIANSKYLLFLDLEGTQFTHEVISIGAYLAKLGKNGKIVSTKRGFYTLVKSREKVSKFITELTNISQDMINKDGISFEEALKKLKKYIGIAYNKVRLVTFGFNDILMLQSSLKHQPENPKGQAMIDDLSKSYIDFQSMINQYIKDDKNQALSLNNCLAKFNLTFTGELHNALADAKNLMILYGAFQSEYNIVVEEYKKVLLLNKKLPRPIAKIMKMLNEGLSVNPKIYNDVIEDEVRD